MLTALPGLFRKEQGTAKALGAIAVGMAELVSGMHRQAFGAERDALLGTVMFRMAVLVERNGSHAATKDTGLIYIPGIKGGIAGDVGGKATQERQRLQIERHKGSDVVFIEGLGVLSQDDVAVLGEGRGGNTRAIAPQGLFQLLLGAIGLFLVGAGLDPQPTIGIAAGLQVGIVAFGDVGTQVVLAHVGVEVGHIEGHHFPQIRNLLVQCL